MIKHLGDLYAESGQTLQGSFSTVSKPRLGLWDSQFQALNGLLNWKALAEIYTMHSFAPLWNRIPKNEENHGGGKDPGPIPGK